MCRRQLQPPERIDSEIAEPSLARVDLGEHRLVRLVWEAGSRTVLMEKLNIARRHGAALATSLKLPKMQRWMQHPNTGFLRHLSWAMGVPPIYFSYRSQNGRILHSDL